MRTWNCFHGKRQKNTSESCREVWLAIAVPVADFPTVVVDAGYTPLTNHHGGRIGFRHLRA